MRFSPRSVPGPFRSPLRGRWLFRHSPDDGKTLIVDPTLPDATPKLPTWQYPVEGGSANNYDYANQDPVNNTDLDGQCLCPIDAWKALPWLWHHPDAAANITMAGLLVVPALGEIDAAAWAAMNPATLVYSVEWQEPVAAGVEGGLFWGLTEIQPGRGAGHGTGADLVHVINGEDLRCRRQYPGAAPVARQRSGTGPDQRRR